MATFRDRPHNWIHTGLHDYDDTRDSRRWSRGLVDERICLDPDSYRDTINSRLRHERDMSANYQDSRSRFYPHDTNRKQLDTHLRPDSLSQYGDSREERHSLDPQASCRTLSDDQLSLGPQQAYRDEPEDRHLTSLYRDEIITPYIAPGEERCTFDRYPDVAPDRPDYRVDPDLSIYPEGSPVQMTEHLMRGRTYGNTQQYNPQPANIDSQVFDYDHGGLETVQNPSRDRFKRIQDSRYSSDRVQDPGHVSDRSQDYSRHSSDRVHDFSGRGSERVQDSSSFCSEKMENSKHLSDTVHDSSRHSSDRMQDSRHSSDRVRDFARHHSDRAQDSSRHHSDRVQDSSRHHSDRIQDFSRHSDRAQDSSRHHSDRAQDSSRHRPDRIQDSRDHLHRPPYPSRHSRNAVGGSVSSTRNDYHSVRLQDSTRHRHGCPPGDDRLNYGSRTSKVDQFVDDSLRHSHSVVDHHQRQLEDYSVHGDSAVGDCSNLDWRTSQDCSVDNYPDKGYSRAQQRSFRSDQRQRPHDRHGFASSSRDKGSRSPDPRRNSREMEKIETSGKYESNKSDYFPEEGMACPVPACDQTWYKKYGKYTDHWLRFHCLSVTLKSCSVCHKQFPRRYKINAIKHIASHQPPATFENVVVPNQHYINPSPFYMLRLLPKSTSASTTSSSAVSTSDSFNVTTSVSTPLTVAPASGGPSVSTLTACPLATTTTSDSSLPLYQEMETMETLGKDESKQLDEDIWPEGGMVCPVIDCDDRWFKHYGKYVNHWLKFHNATVQVKSCSVCHKQFQRVHTAYARRHLAEHQCPATLEIVHMPNLRYIDPSPFQLLKRYCSDDV